MEHDSSAIPPRRRDTQANRAAAAEKDARCRQANCPAYGRGYANCARCSGPVVWKDERGVCHGKARSCHSCPNGGLGLPVCWAACPGPNEDFTTDGQKMVTLGSVESPDDLIYGDRPVESEDDVRNANFHHFDEISSDCDDDYGDESKSEQPSASAEHLDNVTANLSPEVEEACRLVLSEVMGLDETDMRIFYHLYHGRKPARIADEMVISKQAICKRMMKLVATRPWFELFVGSLDLNHAQGGGANRGSRGNGAMFQPDLFTPDVMQRLVTSRMQPKRRAKNRQRVLKAW